MREYTHLTPHTHSYPPPFSFTAAHSSPPGLTPPLPASDMAMVIPSYAMHTECDIAMHPPPLLGFFSPHLEPGHLVSPTSLPNLN